MTLRNPTIYNLALTTSGTEYSQLLPAWMAYFEVKCRTMDDLKMAFVSGQSGSNFITIPAGSLWYANGHIIDVTTGMTIYLQSPTNGVVAEIMVWQK